MFGDRFFPRRGSCRQSPGFLPPTDLGHVGAILTAMRGTFMHWFEAGDKSRAILRVLLYRDHIEVRRPERGKPVTESLTWDQLCATARASEAWAVSHGCSLTPRSAASR